MKRPSVTVVAIAQESGAVKRFGPFNGYRLRDRFLEVQQDGVWQRLAFSIPMQTFEKGAWALWRFLDLSGKEIGFDAQSVEFVI